MNLDIVFLSFTRVVEPRDHRPYNAWHQLDHRPENLALPGVRYGERWVHTPRFAASRTDATDPLSHLHYVNAYWFEEPADESVRAWQDLAVASLDQGRRPDLALAQRLLMGFFQQVHVCVNASVSLSARSLPLRPNRGIHLCVEEVLDPGSANAEARNRWDREERLPRLAELPGVSGAMILSSTSTTLDPAAENAGSTSTLLWSPAATRGRLRIVMTLLDAPPREVEHRLHVLSQPQAQGATDHTRTVFRGVLEPIVPWQWDWFDDDLDPAG